MKSLPTGCHHLVQSNLALHVNVLRVVVDFIPATSNDVLKVICVLLPKTTIYPWQKRQIILSIAGKNSL